MVKTNCSTHIREAPTWNSTMWHTERFRVARARAYAHARAHAHARAFARAIKCAYRVAISISKTQW
eukprot:3289790-Pyramimonas_sp.AAC.1